MSITNDSIEWHSDVESTCETLWDRVLRVCDKWLPCEPRSMRWKAAYSETILDRTLTSVSSVRQPMGGAASLLWYVPSKAAPPFSP